MWLTRLWQRVLAWFRPPAPGGALEAMAELRNEKKRPHPEWDRLQRRLAVLVFSEADRERLWRRAHRGTDDTPRLLSGIVAPTPDEVQRLEALIRELEAGR